MQASLSSSSTPSWGQCVPQSRLPSARCVSLSPHPPTLNPLRFKHPIIPPGCRISSSSALMLQSGSAYTALKNICSEWKGWDKAGQDVEGRLGWAREMRSASHNTICTNTEPSAVCPVKGWRSSASVSAVTTIKHQRKNDRRSCCDEILNNNRLFVNS